MILKELRGNVFSALKYNPYFAHCIASDLLMGAGIAVDFQKKFHLRGKLVESGESLKSPTCVLAGRVFNLITKRRSSGKPTATSMRLAVRQMGVLAWSIGCKRIAMPRIGCGLDRMSWAVVRQILEEELKELDLTVEVFKL